MSLLLLAINSKKCSQSHKATTLCLASIFDLISLRKNFQHNLGHSGNGFKGKKLVSGEGKLQCKKA
jgi:hypothetical protein